MSWIGRLSQNRARQPENSSCLVYFIRNLQPSHKQESLLQTWAEWEADRREAVGLCCCLRCCVLSTQHTLRRVLRNRRAQQCCAKLSSKESFSFSLHKGFFLLAFSEAHRRDCHPGQSLVWWAEIRTC